VEEKNFHDFWEDDFGHFPQHQWSIVWAHVPVVFVWGIDISCWSPVFPTSILHLWKLRERKPVMYRWKSMYSIELSCSFDD
jgi:hypothetical protein